MDVQLQGVSHKVEVLARGCGMDNRVLQSWVCPFMTQQQSRRGVRL
jgi:hypothetical protein